MKNAVNLFNEKEKHIQHLFSIIISNKKYELFKCKVIFSFDFLRFLQEK